MSWMSTEEDVYFTDTCLAVLQHSWQRPECYDERSWVSTFTVYWLLHLYWIYKLPLWQKCVGKVLWTFTEGRIIVLWRCWLVGRKGIQPVKTEWWGAGMVICLERGADLHMAQLMPLPLTVSCYSKIQIGFTFLVPAHPGNTGQRVVKWLCVCVCVCVRACVRVCV